jgi:prepilin-type N-terminal cleavage/methylation domain-containing protein
MCRKGISLIEIIVVVSIIGILALALGFSYQGWIGRYNVEKQIKEIYTDLMTARATAMNKDREYFVDFNNTGSLVNPVTNVTAPCYRIIGDTAAVNDWATDGDGEWDADGDSKIDPVHTVLPGYPKAVEYIINWTGGTLIFDKKGLIKPSSTPLGATLSLTTTADADYDCIKISQTRINMGKMEECDASNPGTECCAK